MQSIVETIESLEKEIAMIQGGTMPLDKAAESAKLRKLQVQGHGHIIQGVRIAGSLQAQSQITTLNDVIGKKIIDITPVAGSPKTPAAVVLAASGAANSGGKEAVAQGRSQRVR